MRCVYYTHEEGEIERERESGYLRPFFWVGINQDIISKGEIPRQPPGKLDPKDPSLRDARLENGRDCFCSVFRPGLLLDAAPAARLALLLSADLPPENDAKKLACTTPAECKFAITHQYSQFLYQDVPYQDLLGADSQLRPRMLRYCSPQE